MNFAVYWNNADFIGQSLYIILLAMSIATWTIFFVRYSNTKQLRVNASQQLKQAIEPLQTQFKNLRLTERKAVAEQALLRQISNDKAKAEKGIAIIGSIASIAPFVGLFGTVWGIFHALVSIGESGQSGLAQVATPVGEALIMTGFGLAVAIPAVLAYNLCTRLNRTFNIEMQDIAHQILLDIMLNKEIKTEEKKAIQQEEVPSTSTTNGGQT